jgi:hypothetical protein
MCAVAGKLASPFPHLDGQSYLRRKQLETFHQRTHLQLSQSFRLTTVQAVLLMLNDRGTVRQSAMCFHNRKTDSAMSRPGSLLQGVKDIQAGQRMASNQHTYGNMTPLDRTPGKCQQRDE